ncbi:MAG: Lrp/AsnC family transcriptional regulator [Candidatus Thermoplasmatota archaeon]
MAKRSREQIREDEKRVIELLEKDSRQTPNEIANKLGFSRQKAWRIIKRLEKENEIWGYTTIITEDKNDLMNLYVALVKSKSPTVKYADKLVERISNNKTEKELGIKLVDMYFLHGTYSWLLIFSAEDIKHAKRFIGYIEKHYGEMIAEVDFLENIFSMLKGGKVNPNIEKINEFALDH